jgi:hypothetical protein
VRRRQERACLGVFFLWRSPELAVGDALGPGPPSDDSSSRRTPAQTPQPRVQEKVTATEVKETACTCNREVACLLRACSASEATRTAPSPRAMRLPHCAHTRDTAAWGRPTSRMRSVNTTATLSGPRADTSQCSSSPRASSTAPRA